MRPLKDSACADREIKLTLVATVETGSTGRDAVLTGAGWANNTFRPEARFQIDSRRLFVGKHLEKLKCADKGFLPGYVPALSTI